MFEPEPSPPPPPLIVFDDGLRMAFIVMCMKLGDLSDDAEEGVVVVVAAAAVAAAVAVVVVDSPDGRRSGAGRCEAVTDDVDVDDTEEDAVIAAVAAEESGRAIGRSSMSGKPVEVT